MDGFLSGAGAFSTASMPGFPRSPHTPLSTRPPRPLLAFADGSYLDAGDSGAGGPSGLDGGDVGGGGGGGTGGGLLGGAYDDGGDSVSAVLSSGDGDGWRRRRRGRGWGGPAAALAAAWRRAEGTRGG
eukprot:TRINITY_DN12482_c0_g1_i1.p4 TRINITY_DN12482_c0_g1~~TRINITY_DN12482_c0_g1_i1.p4  ORF type:complete len:128 (-),score=33.17 TRINITY_DN12482_c0_g1_i1:3-386(-)